MTTLPVRHAAQPMTAPIEKQYATRLKDQREQLIADFLKGKADDFLGRNAALLDEYFRNCFETSMVGPQMNIIKNPYVMIALGGYGRAEQCVFSDVDLLILFEKNVPQATEHLIQELVYPLWDIGLEVGYATRSLKECLGMARQDFEVLTSLLDARFICGVSPLYVRLIEDLRRKVLVKRERDIIRWIIQTNQERHLRLGDSAYLLEPNLKEGRGGLRDYHTMLWIARVRSNIKQPRDLEYYGYLSDEEYNTLDSALAFVWEIRNRLHHMCGRKCDQLYFPQQVQMADGMGFAPDNGHQPVEVFLGRLHREMESIKAYHQTFLYEQGYVGRRTWRKPAKTAAESRGLAVVKARLMFTTPEAVLNQPELLIKIFEESARLNMPLGAEARRLIQQMGDRMDTAFVTSAPVVKSFERILTTPASTVNVLNDMLMTGFLVRFIPEFKPVVDRIQYDDYHLYPVGRHLLRAVRLLKTFGTREDVSGNALCGELYKGLSGRHLLLWATLLHDIGKGSPEKDHAPRGARIAGRVLERMGYRRPDVETVTFLIENHLLLVNTATRRDINDEETAITCAMRIKDARLLKMLYLLTVADCIATGPKAWTGWTASLLRDLFFKVLNIIEKGELASVEAAAAVNAKRAHVLKTAATPEEREDLETLFGFMSPRYLVYAPFEEIVDHVNLYKALGDGEFVWKIRPEMDSDIREVTICAKDRPGLVSKIAGVFTLNSIDILDTQVFTWRNHVALDIFKVKAPLDRIFESERWEKTARGLTDALSGGLDLAEALKRKLSRIRSAKPPVFGKPNRVVVDSESSSFFTIVEVYTYDYPGLLYSITDALLRCRLDVWVAKIATYMDQVVDVFYVRDFDGQKVDADDQVKEILSTVGRVLPGAGKKN